MPYRSSKRRGRTVPALVVATASYLVLKRSGPVVEGVAINVIPALAVGMLALGSFVLLANLFWFVAELFDWLKARKSTGLKGTAGFVRSLRQVRHDLIRHGWGPYWGTFKGKEVISDYASNALTLGPAGTGKGIGVVQPTVLAIHESKTVICFKGENTAVLARPLRERGEHVKILNLGDLWEELFGPSDYYNPLVVIVDNFQHSGGLQDVSDEAHEMCLQLYPDPPGGKGDNDYFYEGSRSKIAFAIQTCILISGPDATLGGVAQMLSRSNLLQHARWAAGRLEQQDGTTAEMPLHDQPWVCLHDPVDVENYIEYYRGLAVDVADLLETEDSRTAEAFLNGAKQALARFNITTRAHKKTSRTTFRFAEQKEGDVPTTVFIVVDASKIHAQMPVLGLLQWCMFQELKRHENKLRPVYLIADEATNFKLHDLGSLLTWGRGYGLRLHLIIQSLSAFRRVYGEDVLNTLLSETEIKQFLAGQREPDTLQSIEKLLGEQSVVAQSHKGSLASGTFGVDGFDYREDARPAMTADEIRRTDKAILIIRKNKPILADLPPIAAIEPFRSQIDINPFHGKPFLRSVKLRLKRQDMKGRQQ